MVRADAVLVVQMQVPFGDDYVPPGLVDPGPVRGVRLEVDLLTARDFLAADGGSATEAVCGSAGGSHDSWMC